MTEVLPLLLQSWDSLLAGNLPPADVIKLLISKMLGYGILVFSTMVKLPQVFNVLRSHSADGLSAVSFELESWGLLVHTAYGYLRGLPFSTYGEAATMFVQNVVLLALIYSYNRMPASRRLAATTMAVGFVTAVVTGHVSMPLISGMYDLNNFILMGARLPQIAKNFAAKTFAASGTSKYTSASSRRNALNHQLASCVRRALCGMLATVAAVGLPALPKLTVFWLYILVVNMYLGLITDLFGIVATLWLKLKVAPSFDRPYLSASMAEFWSQR
eukprot:gene13397-13525_t